MTVLTARQPRVATDPKQLFVAGLAAVATRMPVADAVHDGIEAHTWVEVAGDMIASQADLLGWAISARLLFAPGDKVGTGRLRRTIDEALDEGAVVIVCLSGLHDHYTLIVRHTPTRYVLHDSGDLRWLAKAACGTDRSSTRHRVAPRWVMAMERALPPVTGC